MLNKLIVLTLLLLTGCGQTYYGKGRKQVEQGQYDLAIESFYGEIAANPDNWMAWRELGVAFYNQRDLVKAEDALSEANDRMPDARTHLYLGMTHEKRGEIDKALAAYAASLGISTDKKTRYQVRAHMDRLIQKRITDDVAFAISREAEINADTIPQNTIAVVNFDGSLLSPELAPLAVGLAEFASNDLAKIKSLRVVERMKIDAVLNELKLSQSGYVDQTSAPRIGRLVGSHKIVTGSLVGVGATELRLNAAIIGTSDSTARPTNAVEGRVEKLFEIEKDFVFDVVRSLGITLTADERNAIEEVPTESYLAILAYSRGLYYRQRGMDAMAGQEFENALSHDAAFGAARAQLMSSLGGSSLSYQSSLENLETLASELKTAVAGGLEEQLAILARNTGLIPESVPTTANSQPRVPRASETTVTVRFDHD